MALNLITIRQTCRQFARNALGSTQYPDQQIDVAFSQRADELIRRAWLLLTLNQISTTASSNAVPTMPTNFRPDRIKQAYLTGSNVVITPWTGPGYSPYYSIGAPVNPNCLYRTAKLQLPPFLDVLNRTLAYQANPPLGQPTDIAFDQLSGSGLFWPTPDQIYTVNIQWNQL